LGSLLPRV